MLNIKIFSKVLIVIVAALSLICCTNDAKMQSSNLASSADSESLQRFYGTNVSIAEEKDFLANTTLNFPVNGYELTAKQKLIVLAYARKMLDEPSLKLRVEGHTDERGSAEYNIGLGERRAKSVAKILGLKGVATSRVAVVSYGKEKPLAFGHSESSWYKNRRSEMHFESLG